MANRPQETLNFKKGYGENFKKLRESRKLTQTELAEQIGYTNRTISLIEKEERKPTIEQLKIYCDKFNVSLDYLTGRTNTPYPDTQLVSEYTGLSEKSIEKLKRINHFNADGSENPDKSFIDILDRFIQSKYFSELIVYWESLHTHSTEWKEKEMKTNEDYIYKGQLNQSCDIARYNVSRMIEKISDEFDRRENDEHNSKQK